MASELDAGAVAWLIAWLRAEVAAQRVYASSNADLARADKATFRATKMREVADTMERLAHDLDAAVVDRDAANEAADRLEQETNILDRQRVELVAERDRMRGLYDELRRLRGLLARLPRYVQTSHEVFTADGEFKYADTRDERHPQGDWVKWTDIESALAERGEGEGR